MKKAMAYPDVTPKNTQPIPMMAVHDLKWTGERVPRTKKLYVDTSKTAIERYATSPVISETNESSQASFEKTVTPRYSLFYPHL